ncbi:hypothetical protein C8J56DRAFT_725770, partial [Mycena floridula]
TIPPRDGILIYMARVDPYMTSGCDVILDVSEGYLGELEEIQVGFLRRLLGVHSRSSKAPLFTETGVQPIRHRRIVLALKSLRYLIGLPDDHLGYLAMQESQIRAGEGESSWISDLLIVLGWLKVCAPMIRREFTVADRGDPMQVEAMIDYVEALCDSELQLAVNCSAKLWLLQDRHEGPREERKQGSSIFKLRQYLTEVDIPAHRKAFTRLVMSAHFLAVEGLRHAGRDRLLVPRHWRLCCFCKREVETEGHAVLSC